jgi:pectate lyase
MKVNYLRIIQILSLLLFLSGSYFYLQAEMPAFPGAEGFGADNPGGRGGRVIRVTNLNPDGPGSLQAACNEQGPRIVVFEVSGVIPATVSIPHGSITIAGQTAPGAGITIQGMLRGPEYNGVKDSTYINDVVVRFLRIRPTPGESVPGSDCDAIQLGRIDGVVIDHVSCSWANDETIDIYVTRNVTIQWTTIEESDPTGHHKGQHNFGLIGGPKSWNASVHHCLFANHRRRNPAFANGPADFRNNLVFNFRDGFSHEGHPPNGKGFNIIGNYYKAGPSDPNIFPFCFSDTVHYYLRDNYIEGVGMIQDPWREADKLYGLRYYAHKGQMAPGEIPMPPVTTVPPQEVYPLVMESAGCFPRDSVTRRTINELREGKGEWRRRHPGDLMAGLIPGRPLADSDGDGMPDVWESAMGLDPTESGDHGTEMHSGYTAIEEYCNILAHRLVDTKGVMPVRGDVNGNGDMSAGDLFALLKIWMSGTHSWAADMDIDGEISLRDISLWWDI